MIHPTDGVQVRWVCPALGARAWPTDLAPIQRIKASLPARHEATVPTAASATAVRFRPAHLAV